MKVTHFLFGGDDFEMPELKEAQAKKIPKANEYFLRLLVKY